MDDLGSAGVDQRSTSTGDSVGANPASPRLEVESAQANTLEQVAISLQDFLSKVSFTLTYSFHAVVHLSFSYVLTLLLPLVVGCRELMCWLT